MCLSRGVNILSTFRMHLGPIGQNQAANMARHAVKPYCRCVHPFDLQTDGRAPARQRVYRRTSANRGRRLNAVGPIPDVGFPVMAALASVHSDPVVADSTR